MSICSVERMTCHFDRSDAKHRGAEKSVEINRFLDSLRSLGMTTYDYRIEDHFGDINEMVEI